jgi:membrane-associated phospholipid phosphatase
MKTANKINIVFSIIFLICLILIVFTGTNKDLFLSINSLTAKQTPFIWANLTFLGDSLAASVTMLLFIRKRPDLIWSAIIATVFATLISHILKLYINSPRPPAVLSKDVINIIGPHLFSHSFPSGHTVTIFTLTGILLFYFKSVYARIILIVLALLVGLSRIAVGVHWPADVLAGAVLGLICATSGVYFVEKLKWGRMKQVQLVLGFVLVVSTLYLLLFYNCRYEQAIYLQTFFSIAVLITGLREYYLLLKND